MSRLGGSPLKAAGIEDAVTAQGPYFDGTSLPGAYAFGVTSTSTQRTSPRSALSNVSG